MNPKLRLKVFPVVLLMVVQVVGMGGVARSQVVAQQSVNQSQEIDRLIQQLKSGDSQVRWHAVLALGRISEAIPSLIPLLNDLDADVRSAAAYALGQMGKPVESAIPSLIPLLQDSSKQVRLSAIYALGSVGFSEKPVIPFLIPILNDRDPDVRFRAAISVARTLASARLDVFSVEQFPTDVLK
jgi:HEAT repeat protein